jgi:hypothetical protein
VASRNSKNKGDWQTQTVELFSAISQLSTFISKFIADVKGEVNKKTSKVKTLSS